MPTLLVSFHGGDKEIDNIVAYPDGGKPYELLSTATPSAVVHPLKELRKFLFSPSGQDLYVANGSKNLSQLLRFTPPSQPGGQWRYGAIFADKLAHPFDAIFGFNALFVSSQDSGVVARFSASGAGQKFAEGFKAVRGLACDGTSLYVADSGRDRVSLYDDQGKAVGSFEVKQPVHLLYVPARKWLLIGSEAGNSVVAWNPAEPKKAPLTVVSNTSPAIDHTAGIALRPGTGNVATLYVASREAHEVLSFPLEFLSSGQPVWTPRTTAVALTKAQLKKEEPEFVGIQGGLYG
jgi:hypothetical protein